MVVSMPVYVHKQGDYQQLSNANDGLELFSKLDLHAVVEIKVVACRCLEK